LSRRPKHTPDCSAAEEEEEEESWSLEFRGGSYMFEKSVHSCIDANDMFVTHSTKVWFSCHHGMARPPYMAGKGTFVPAHPMKDDGFTSSTHS
jgi:hypothetical protein